MHIPPISRSNSVESIESKEDNPIFGVAPASPTPGVLPTPMEVKEKLPEKKKLPIEITPMDLPNISPASSPKHELPKKSKREFYFLGGALALVGIYTVYKKYFNSEAQSKIKTISFPVKSIKITSQNKV